MTSISEEDLQLFESIQAYTQEQETSAKERFKQRIKAEEKEIQTSWQEMKERNADLVEALNLNVENVVQNDVANKISQLSPSDFAVLRRKYGGRQLSKKLKALGLDDLDKTSPLVKAVNIEVEKAVSDKRLVKVLNVFGGKEAMKNVLMKLATHETAGPPIRPFNWSSTACMGYFHFNLGNTKNYKINPTNPAEAVRGELMLMADNLDYLKGKTSVNPQMLLGAHNSGVGNALRNRSAGYGNPKPTEFARIVMNKTDYSQIIAQFQSTQNQEEVV